MHKVRTAWPTATRVQYVVAYEECRRRWGVSARRFCSAAEIPYSTFARWWAGWRKASSWGEKRKSMRLRPGRASRVPCLVSPISCLAASGHDTMTRTLSASYVLFQDM